MMDTQVTERICTAGTLVKGEVVDYSRFEDVRVCYKRKHTGVLLRYTCTYSTHAARAVCTPLYIQTQL